MFKAYITPSQPAAFSSSYTAVLAGCLQLLLTWMLCLQTLSKHQTTVTGMSAAQELGGLQYPHTLPTCIFSMAHKVSEIFGLCKDLHLCCDCQHIATALEQYTVKVHIAFAETA